MSCTPASDRRVVDLLVGEIAAHAADVLLDRARKQLDLLRQIAGVFAELPAVPVAQLGAVEPDLARGRQQASDQNPRQRRLARAGRTDDRQRFAGLQLEVDAVEDGLLGAGRQIEQPCRRLGVPAASAGAGAACRSAAPRRRSRTRW